MNPILQVIHYFAVFSYPPTIDEIYMFLRVRMSKAVFRSEIEQLITEQELYKEKDRLASNRSLFSKYNKKREISQFYFAEAIKNLSWIKIIPQVQFLGISGSLSMFNTSVKGDIDIFVIVNNDSVWTVRAILLFYKKLLSVINRRIAHKFCFNMFLSEKGLPMPVEKVNEYIGHELLQLKPIVNKNKIYDRLLGNNNWVFTFFPNVQIIKSKSYDENRLSSQSKYVIIVELFLKKIQTWWLTKKNIVWVERKGQLWLIQEDFQLRLNKHIKSLL